jgi:hypothetical protein
VRRLLLTSVIALSFFVAIPVSSNAADRPAWHIGVLRKSASPATCTRFAKNALSKYNYAVLFDNNNTVLGGDDHVVVEVVCAPRNDGGSLATVSAFSNDSTTAEAARNNVRTYIAGAVCIDSPC